MTGEQNEAREVVKRRRRRRRRWCALILLLALGAWFSRFAYLRITREPTPRSAYWEALGAELDPPPPGAIPSADAFRRLADRPWETDPQFEVLSDEELEGILDGPWDPMRSGVQWASAIFESDAFRKPAASLREACQAGWAVNLSPATWSRTGWQDAQSWSRWLIAHSRWARESQNDSQTAAEDWLAVFRLTRQFRRARASSSLVLGSLLEPLVAKEIILASREPQPIVDAPSLIREIDTTLDPLSDPPALLDGDRLSFRAALEAIYVREGGDWLAVNRAIEMLGNTGGAPVPRLWNLTSPLFHDHATAAAAVDEVFASLADCRTIASCGDYDRSVGPGILDGWPNRYGGFVEVHRQTLTGVYVARTSVEAAMAMLALRTHHDRHGAYPPTLDALVPDLLPRLPIDYEDRRPLRYSLTDGGFLLSGAGPDWMTHGRKGGALRWPRGFDFGQPVVYSAIQRSAVGQ